MGQAVQAVTNQLLIDLVRELEAQGRQLGAIAEYLARELPAPVVNVTTPEVVLPDTVYSGGRVFEDDGPFRVEVGNFPDPPERIVIDRVDNLVRVSGPVRVTNDTAHPVPVSVTNTTTEIANDAGNPVPVSGTVAVSAAAVADTNNSSTATLGAGSAFTGTATLITAYAQAVVSVYGRPGVVAGDGSSAKASMFVEFSPDGTNWDTSIPHVIRDPSLVIPIPVISIPRYFRLRYLNDGGVAAIAALGLVETAGTPTAQTAFRLNTWLYPLATKELTRTLDQGIQGTDPAGLMIAAGIGKNPDGLWQDMNLGGTKTLTPTPAPLGSGGVYTSAGIDTDHYPTVKLLVATDVASADNGVVLQWSDTLACTTVRSQETRTFRAANAATGLLIQTTTRARYLRIVYTNGATVQTRFFLNLRLNPVPLATLIDIDPIQRGQTGQQDVTLVATQVAASPLAGRFAFRLKNLTTSARPLFYGFSGSLTTANGDELAAGESVEFDADEFVTVYVQTTSTAGAGVRCAFTEFA
ncbi:MAG TPA: hypothetical protein VMZ71_14765 [Gemmataceae bacterium]|nr:hypothetical protein [Gemmataceae bacterium]